MQLFRLCWHLCGADILIAWWRLAKPYGNGIPILSSKSAKSSSSWATLLCLNYCEVWRQGEAHLCLLWQRSTLAACERQRREALSEKWPLARAEHIALVCCYSALAPPATSAAGAFALCRRTYPTSLAKAWLRHDGDVSGDVTLIAHSRSISLQAWCASSLAISRPKCLNATVWIGPKAPAIHLPRNQYTSPMKNNARGEPWHLSPRK